METRSLADRLWGAWEVVKIAYMFGAFLLVAVMVVAAVLTRGDSPRPAPATTTDSHSMCDGPDAASCGDLYEPPEYVPGEGGW